MVDFNQLVTQLALGLLAIFSSMTALLVWLIKRQAEQVEKLTDRFTTALENTVSRNTEAQSQMTQGLIIVTSNVTELTTTIREFMASNRDEHRALMDAIGKVDRHTHND